MSEAVNRVLERLDGVRKDGTGWNAKCPAHDDSKNSLHIAEGKDGRAVVHCHAGCPTQQVVHKAGLSIADLFIHGSSAAAGAGRRGDAKATREWGKVVATYDYVDENGVLVYQVLRDEHKNFKQRRPKPGADPGEDAWLYNIEGARKLLYKLPEVVTAIAAQKAGAYPYPILICEGEKDVDNLAALGLIATTNSGGSLKWSEDHTAQLAGALEVAILPDNDEPGRRHARAVGAALRGKVSRVRTIRLPNLPEKGDVSDFIAAGGTRDQLLEICSKPSTPDGWVSARTLIDTEAPDVDWIIPDLITSGSNVILSGEAKVLKSWIAWDMAIGLSVGGLFVGQFPCRKSRVMVVSADEPMLETRRKMKYLTAYMNGSGAPLATDLLIHGGDVELNDPDTLSAMADAVSEFCPDVVFVDSMEATIEGDENKREFVRNARKVARAIRAAYSPCAIIFIHHWGKPTKDRPNTPASRMRGFSGLRGFVSHHLCIERSPDNVLTFIVDANRHGLELSPFSLIPRIIESEGVASFEYAGPTRDRTGQTGAPAAVLELLERVNAPMKQTDIYTALAERFSSSAVKEGIRSLLFAREPKIKKDDAGGGRGRSPVIHLIGATGTHTGRLVNDD